MDFLIIPSTAEEFIPEPAGALSQFHLQIDVIRLPLNRSFSALCCVIIDWLLKGTVAWDF
jgi:hypothetical protein